MLLYLPISLPLTLFLPAPPHLLTPRPPYPSAKVVAMESGRARRAMEQSVRKEYDEELRVRDEKIAAQSRHGSQGSAWRAKDAAEEAEAEARALMEVAEAEATKSKAAEAKASRRVSTLEDRLRHAGEVRVEARAKQKALVESLRAAALESAELQDAEMERAVEEARAHIEKLEGMLPPLPPTARTEDAWARLAAAALRKARSRERQYISAFLETRAWQMSDWANVLDQTVDGDGESLLDDLWNTKEVQLRHFAEVRALFKKLEREHWGERLGMHCRLELHMTFASMLQLTQAASKVYQSDRDFYAPKVPAHPPPPRTRTRTCTKV